MKLYKRGSILLLLVVCIMLAGCGASINTKRFTDSDKISIVTSIYPVYDFACNIAGDKAEIINLVPAGMEPHDFELSTNDMQLLESADVFIYNGADMEHFVDKTLNALSNENLCVVETAKDVKVLESGEHPDPHTWLSVANAMKQAEAIKEVLISVDADNASYYEDNYSQYIEKLEILHQSYKEELQPYEGQSIVVAHEAFGYLCKEYGLKQEGIEGLSADSEPDSARMKEIVDFCKENEIKVIFFEELVSPKVAQTIADEIGAETMVLNPIEGLTASQMEGGVDYIRLMEQNLENLKEALQK